MLFIVSPSFFQKHTMLLHRYLKEFYPKTGGKKFAESFVIRCRCHSTREPSLKGKALYS
jgi:hypothetical protein